MTEKDILKCPACQAILTCTERSLGENLDTGGLGTERSYRCVCGYHAVLILIEKFRQPTLKKWNLGSWPGWETLKFVDSRCCSAELVLAVPEGSNSRPSPHVCLHCRTAHIV